jgi:hypothetical protein
MPSTYTPIATTTLGSAGTVTFSSIPSTYTDLIVVAAGTATGNGQFSLRFNGGTSLYSTTTLTANGSGAGSTRETAPTYLQLGYYEYFDSNQTVAIGHIMNYANTTTFKTVISRTSNASAGVGASVGLWRSTAAINSVTVLPTAAYNFSAGTVVSLYGVKSA